METISTKVLQVLRKDKCEDMFTYLDNINNIKPPSQFIGDYVKIRFKKKIIEINLRKLDLFISIGIFGGINYPKAILRRIKLIKDYFMLELENGKPELIIPYELS